MKFCTNCSLNLEGVELQKDGQCPRCDTEIVHVKDKKLNDLLSTLNAAYVAVYNNPERKSPKQLLNDYTTIDKGEKKLQKELTRREEMIRDLANEITAINHFGNFLGYQLEAITDTPITYIPEDTENDEYNEHNI